MEWHNQASSMTPSRPRWWLTPALCLLLAIVHTWPLATAPGTLSRNDNGDAQLNEWIMAWVAHQLPRAPARLFNANIFYPARDTLAFSEPLIVPALMGAPLQWLGASPVLVYNIVLIAGFALTAWATSALVFSWTGTRAAGLLAGSAFAFNTHTLTRLAHMQGIHVWGLPLALLAADRIISRALLRDTVWLAIWMSAMAYTSGYLLVFASVMIAIVVLARAVDWAHQPARILGAFGLSAALACVASLPVYLPYHRVARDQGMVRSLASVGQYSATLKGYLAASGRVHFYTWSGNFFRDPVDSFFPGVIVIVCAALAIWYAVRSRESDPASHLTSRRVAMLVSIAAAGFVLSLGTRTPVYGWLFQIFPPMQGLRAAARFGNLFLLGMACLAGIGLAGLLRRLPARRTVAFSVAIVAIANVESLRAPFEYARFDGVPALYSLLADEPGPVVLVETPFYPPQAIFENAGYVLASTAHWRPLMNGYSGYVPDTYRTYAASFWFFPEDFAIREMRKAGVTHVMVHPQRFYQDATKVMEKVAASPYLERLAIGRNGDALYRLH
jgi:hypothetical protein